MKLSELFENHTPPEAPSPEGVTNRPRDLRLLAMSGAIRQAPREPSRLGLLAIGVLTSGVKNE
jgi:hypothetical protein